MVTLDLHGQRIRDLAAAACQSLDARTLNLLSFHIAVYLDQQASNCVFEALMTAEIEAEQARRNTEGTLGTVHAVGVAGTDQRGWFLVPVRKAAALRWRWSSTGKRG